MLFVSTIYAQSITNNFAIGSLSSNGNVFDAAIAHSGVALLDTNNYSLSNPASWYGFKKVAFTTIFDGHNVTMNYDTPISNGFSRLTQLGISFPFGKHIGVVIGLEPVSNVDGFIENNSDEVNYSQAQSGGLKRLYTGIGSRYGQISFGVKYGLLSGYLGQRKLAAYNDDSYRWDAVEYAGNSTASDIQLGAIWAVNNEINIGLSFSTPLKQITYTGDAQYFNYSRTLTNDANYLNWVSFNKDNISNTGSSLTFEENIDALPTEINIGTSIQLGKKLSVQLAIDQKIFPSETTNGQNAFLVPVGWKMNDCSSIRIGLIAHEKQKYSYNYFDRIKYGVGLYYGNDYVTNESSDISNVFKISGGLKFPLSKDKSTMSLSGYWGNRSNFGDLPSEELLGFSLGISVNEIWFVKAKRR
jgi:hypothetical protein